MRHFRFTYLRKFLSLFLTIAILNVVIDAPDHLINLDADLALEEDLSINEMESVMEVFLEQGLDIENAFPETDDQDSENMCKKVELLQFFQLSFTKLEHPAFLLLSDNQTSFCDYSSLGTLRIDSPPPKV